MSNKLLTRFAEFVNNQTEEPTKKQLNKAIKKLYEKKANNQKFKPNDKSLIEISMEYIYNFITLLYTIFIIYLILFISGFILIIIENIYQ